MPTFLQACCCFCLLFFLAKWGKPQTLTFDVRIMIDFPQQTCECEFKFIFYSLQLSDFEAFYGKLLQMSRYLFVRPSIVE